MSTDPIWIVIERSVRRMWRGREFHITAAAIALAMMGVYLLPPPAEVEFEPDETTMAIDHLLESDLDNLLESLADMDRPGPETKGEPSGDS